MKKSTDTGEIMYSNAFWDVFGWLISAFVAFFGITLLVACAAGIIVSILRISDSPVAYGFVLIFCIMGSLAVGSTLRANIVSAAEVYLCQEEIIGKSMFRVTRRIRYDEIAEFHNGWLYVDGEKSPRIEIGKVDEMGELFEVILERAVNCRRIHLDEATTTGDSRIWQKDPNWDIINRAKRRAEANAAAVHQPSKNES